MTPNARKIQKKGTLSLRTRMETEIILIIDEIRANFVLQPHFGHEDINFACSPRLYTRCWELHRHTFSQELCARET